MKRILIFAWVASLAAAVALGIYWRPGSQGAAVSNSSDPTETSRPPQLTVKATLHKLNAGAVAVGNLTVDPDREGRVGSPLAGRVTEIYRAVGDGVSVGDPLALVTSPEITRIVAEHHHAELRLAQAQASLRQSRQAIQQGDETRRPLEEARSEVVSTSAERAVRVSAQRLSAQNLRRARDLFKLGVISRRELELAQAEYAQAATREKQAEALAGLARQHETRERSVAAAGALIGPRLNQLETELRLADEEVRHQELILRTLGLDSEQHGQGLILRAPTSGIVVERSLSLGQAISPDQELFRIVNTRGLWLWIFLHEGTLAGVRVGTPVRVEVGGTERSGRVSYVAPLLDPETRTVKARVSVDNLDGTLRPGLFARVHFPARESRSVLGVPLDATSVEGTSTVVFRPQGSTYERVVVQLGARHEDWVEVLSGLRAGDEVAARATAIQEWLRR